MRIVDRVSAEVKVMAHLDIVIVQPLVPLYRESFFEGLRKQVTVDIYVYHSEAYLKANGFVSAGLSTKHIANIHVGKAILINILPLLLGPHKVVILCAENKIVSNWIVLLLGRLFGKQVILWGHGLDARFYNEQVGKMPFMRRLMYRLADGAWFYTENEQAVWRNLLPNLKSVALGNTVDVPLMKPVDTEESRLALKKQYGIKTDMNFIFCARFNNPNRRINLLVRLIERLDKSRFGFIIIGGGDLKPDFSSYSNVYDFGPVYEKKLKNDLFGLADVYFQPAWTGLSIVEAMAYGKPVFTFKRSKDILQCVEYGYIVHGLNGMIFESPDELIEYVTYCEKSDINALGMHAREYVRENLTMENMVANALKGIKMVVHA